MIFASYFKKKIFFFDCSLKKRCVEFTSSLSNFLLLLTQLQKTNFFFLLSKCWCVDDMFFVVLVPRNTQWQLQEVWSGRLNSFWGLILFCWLEFQVVLNFLKDSNKRNYLDYPFSHEFSNFEFRFHIALRWESDPGQTLKLKCCVLLMEMFCLS